MYMNVYCGDKSVPLHIYCGHKSCPLHVNCGDESFPLHVWGKRGTLAVDATLVLGRETNH